MTQTSSGAVRGVPHAERCLVMGVVNVTPDSFSDGGLWFDPETAIRHGLDLVAEGADIVDVGGESTRPGAQRVSLAEELRRVVPVITELAARDVYVSVDTMRAEVAEAALAAGARLVNDVSGGLADPAMPRLVAQAQVPYVVMHWRGHSRDMQTRANYRDVVADVRAELEQRMDAVIAEGVDPASIIVDPGLGFGKRPEHNWSLLADLDKVSPHGRPLLIGPSRKRFLARLLAGTGGTSPAAGDASGGGTEADPAPRPFAECDDATVATVALAAAAGAWCVRVHSVRPNADAVRVAQAWRHAATHGAPGAGGGRLSGGLAAERPGATDGDTSGDVEVGNSGVSGDGPDRGPLPERGESWGKPKSPRSPPGERP